MASISGIPFDVLAGGPALLIEDLTQAINDNAGWVIDPKLRRKK